MSKVRTDKILLDLLAVIHRDGGHHTIAVGYEKSFEDAVKKFHSMAEMCEKLEQAAGLALHELRKGSRVTNGELTKARYALEGALLSVRKK